MHEIELDGSLWRNSEDFYAALLPALGAPEWHGHNLDALNDSIAGRDINAINPPLVVRIFGCAELPPEVRNCLAGFIELIADPRSRGVEVDASCSNASAPGRVP